MIRDRFIVRSGSMATTLLRANHGRTAAAVATPWDGSPIECDDRAGAVVAMLDVKSNIRGFIDLDDALAWAGKAIASLELDEQFCLGERFDRHLIADTLEVVRAAGVPGDAEALVELVKLSSGAAMRITASFTAAIVCALRPGTVGRDPMPTRPRSRIARAA